MSSRRNHVKRSHRSERRRRSIVSGAERRAYYAPQAMHRRNNGIAMRVIEMIARRMGDAEGRRNDG